MFHVGNCPDEHPNADDPTLPCWALRHESGRKVRPDEAMNEILRLRSALNDAMTSLEWIASRTRGKDEADLEARMEMKGYAGSRARVAREALAL